MKSSCIPTNFIMLLCMMLPMVAHAFVVPSASSAPALSASSLLQAVKYDRSTEQWSTDDPLNDGPSAGYGIWGTLLRGGPKPFFSRLVTPDTYEQAVLKFMAGDKVDRMTAQGNMDAFLENGQDWAYNRMQGYDVDYVTVKQKDVLLRVVWSSIVVALAGRAAVAYQTGDNFWNFLP